MFKVSRLLVHGRGLAPTLVKRATWVELEWDVRQRSRFDATDSAGRSLAVFLPRGTVVRGGDVLVVEDGSLVRVLAARQPVMVVSACSQHPSPFDLLRAAYHLGNRHVPLELTADRLKLEPDHVLADLLRRMSLIVIASNEPFEPEHGAYAAGHAAHAHSSDDAADHSPSKADGHAHSHAHAAAHANSAGRGHAHDD